MHKGFRVRLGADGSWNRVMKKEWRDGTGCPFLSPYAYLGHMSILAMLCLKLMLNNDSIASNLIALDAVQNRDYIRYHAQGEIVPRPRFSCLRILGLNSFFVS